MVSSLFAPSRKRSAARWRAFQRPFWFALVLVTCCPVHASDRRVEKRVAPEYPVLARRMNIAGTVRLTATVSPDGSVTAVKAESGNAILVPAAEEAVRKWKFAPAGAATSETVNVNFALGN